MPIYEYFCSTCQTRFELMRPISRSGEGAQCPRGHPGARRVLSLFASFSKASDGTTMAVAGTGGGCAACAGGSCAACSPS